MEKSAPLRDTFWPKEKDYAPLKWSHHQHKIHKQSKDKHQALKQVNKTKNKIKDKIIPLLMKINLLVTPHQMMSKIKFKVMHKSPMMKAMIKLSFKNLWRS